MLTLRRGTGASGRHLAAIPRAATPEVGMKLRPGYRRLSAVTRPGLARLLMAHSSGRARVGVVLRMRQYSAHKAAYGAGDGGGVESCASSSALGKRLSTSSPTPS